MTEERKKYLASISKEEWIIRLNIIGLKARIRDEKFWLNHVTGDTEEQIKQTLWRINSIKIIIKSLKKQLPAPLEQCFDGRIHYIGCSVCKFQAEPYYAHCPCCGQKLR